MDIIQTMVMSLKNKENENEGGPAWLFFTEKTGREGKKGNNEFWKNLTHWTVN